MTEEEKEKRAMELYETTIKTYGDYMKKEGFYDEKEILKHCRDMYGLRRL